MAAKARSVPTAMATGTPRKVSTGVTSAPPPTPLTPTRIPASRPSRTYGQSIIPPGVSGRLHPRRLRDPRGETLLHVEGELGDAARERPVGRIDRQLGLERRLVRRRDAGEVLDLARARPPV